MPHFLLACACDLVLRKSLITHRLKYFAMITSQKTEHHALHEFHKNNY